MKLTELLIITAGCSMILVRSEAVDVGQEALLKRAADQLDRLTPYRRTAEDRAEDLANLLETWKPVADQNHLDGTGKSDADQNVPWEVLEVLPDRADADVDEAKQADDDGTITIGVIADPQYAAIMRDRIKRGWNHGLFNPGSGSFLASVAGGVLSGVATASSSSAGKASASSSTPEQKPSYGVPSPAEHAYSYGVQTFGPWEFKKAIFGTLFQALKAIGGGVLALKGQLVKGSSYLLAAKSRAFAKTGDAITSFGKNLAASALADSKPYPPQTYYEHPPSQNIVHDPGYQGPPPTPDDYSEANEYAPHETYGVPSDDNNQGGLLIVTPTKSDPDEHTDQHADVVVEQEKPDLATLEESFGGPTQGTVITNLLNSLPQGSAHTSGANDQPLVNQDHNNLDLYSAIQHPSPAVGALDHYTTNHDNPIRNYEQSLHAGEDAYHHHHHHHHQPQLPPQAGLPPHHFPDLGLGDLNLAIQPNVGYPPAHHQHFQYPNPQAALLNSPKLPHDDGGTSVYSSLSIDTEPQIAPLKVSLPVPYSDGLDLPKLQAHVDFHRQPQFANHVHGSLGGPLRIPLANAIPGAYYWQSQGIVPTSAFNAFHQFHKKNSLHRRMFAKRRARYSPLERLHRL